MTAAVAPPLTPTVRHGLARLRFPLLIAGLVVLVVVIPLLLGGGIGSSRDFAEDGKAPNGAGALAAVLSQHGVQVDPVSRLADARAASGATLLVDDQDDVLTEAQWRSLAAAAPALVVVAPGGAAARVLLGQDAQLAGVPEGASAAARCPLPAARRAGSLSLADAADSVRAPGATVCFPDARGAGQIAQRTVDGTVATLIASAEPFENRHIAARGDAAVALGLLGTRSHLVWYVPDPLDLPAQGARTLQQLTPPWVTPFMVLLLLAGIAAAFWRGRRLGPLVVERLPVVVRTRETVEGRARLYDRGRDRLRAADALRMGAIGRMAPLAGLSRSSGTAEVVAAVAAQTGRPLAAVQAVLLDAEPRDDAALVRLSDDVAALEAALSPARPTDHGRGPGTESPR